jgi:hypothetical protein
MEALTLVAVAEVGLTLVMAVRVSFKSDMKILGLLLTTI